MRIVKTKDSYDPEGLNIPSTYFEILWEGPYQECLERLNNIRSSKITQFQDRNDIDVGKIQLRRKVITQIPLKTGGYQIVTEARPQSEYFEIYFMSAISKEYYSIVE